MIIISIAVLVAIAIPVFTSQLERSQVSSDAANIRSIYAQVVAKEIDSSVIASSDETFKAQSTSTLTKDSKEFGTTNHKADLPAEGYATITLQKGETYQVSLNGGKIELTKK